MKSIKKSFSRPLALAFAVLIGVIAYQAFAMSPAGPTSPAVVATVDLQMVYNALSENSESKAELTELTEEIDAKIQSLRQEIERLQEDLGVLPPGSEQARKTEEQMMFKSYFLREYQQQAVAQIDAAQARELRDQYDDIKIALSVIAEEHDYDLVLVDDSVVQLPPAAELSPGSARGEMMRQISARRMLYTSPRIDITQMVIDRMQQAFQARQGN